MHPMVTHAAFAEHTSAQCPGPGSHSTSQVFGLLVLRDSALANPAGSIRALKAGCGLYAYIY